MFTSRQNHSTTCSRVSDCIHPPRQYPSLSVWDDHGLSNRRSDDSTMVREVMNRGRGSGPLRYQAKGVSFVACGLATNISQGHRLELVQTFELLEAVRRRRAPGISKVFLSNNKICPGAPVLSTTGKTVDKMDKTLGQPNVLVFWLT